MATYPLKNISIGGDTYEIQAGNIGIAYYNINIESYDSPDIWNHTGLTWNHIIRVNTDGTVQNLSFGDLYADEELHSWDLPIFVSLKVVGGGRGMWPCSVLGKTSGSYTIVADGVYNGTACYITITANTSTINSAYGETLSSGGGGGGASVTVYKIASQWTDMDFGTMTTAQEVWLKDANTSANINISALASAFANGPVYLQDSRLSKAQIINLVFDSGNMPQYCYVLVPNSEFGAKIRALKWMSGDQNFRLSDVNI